MGVAWFLLSIGINIILIAVVYLILRRRIDKQGSTEYVLGNVRSEVGEMITELNQTADRNIGLLEARLSRMKEMIDKADSRLSLLQKETDKQTRGAATYSSVRPRIVQTPAPEKPVKAEKPAESARGKSAGIEAADEEKEGGTSAAAPKQEAASGTAPEKKKRRESAGTPDKRARVIELHRQGISPDIIASRLDSTIGEVELIITMAEGRGR